MSNKRPDDLTNALRKVLENSTTRWLDHAPQDGGDLIGIVYCRRDAVALLVHHMTNDTFVVQRYMDTTVAEAASTIAALAKTPRGPLSSEKKIERLLLDAPQILIARYNTSKKFAYWSKPKPPLPMKPLS